jgi:hypothetical protein
MDAEQVLELVREQIGVCEDPMGSNSGTPYHEWYGPESQGWQWCAIFVSWVIHHTDPALFFNLKTAYSGDFLTTGRSNGREVDISDIAPGDICIWDRPIGGITDHIGFVESVTPTTFTTIEGNSGDCVKRNADRPRIQTSDCHYYFVRPLYTEQPKEKEMALVTSGKPIQPGEVFSVTVNPDMDGNAWTKVYNPSSKVPVSGRVSFSTSKAVPFTIAPNGHAVLGAKQQGAVGETQIAVTADAPVVVTVIQ